MKVRKILTTMLTAGTIAFLFPAAGEYRASEVNVPDPVMKVTFDDGTATDITGNGNNGTVKGTPEFVNGKVGKAVHIVNSDSTAGASATAEQYIDFGRTDSLTFGTADFSIAFWYKSDRSADSHKEGAVISNKDWGSGNNEGLNFGDMKQGLNMNYRAGGNGRKETDRYSEITDGKWHFITGTFDRDGDMTLYIDGELPTKGNGYQSKTPNVSISDQMNSIDSKNFIVGADGAGAYGLQNGYIDEVSVYKQVLTQEQIKSLGTVVDGEEDGEAEQKDLVLDVNFDNSSAVDSVAGNNGAITGNVQFIDGISGKAAHIVNSKDVAGANVTAEQYINFGEPENLKFGTDDYTIMFWYQSDGSLPKEGAVVSNKNWSSGGNPGFAVGDMSNGMTLNFRAANSSGRLDTGRYGGATEAGKWHHVAAVFNRTGNMTLYIDGEAAGSKSISAQAGQSIDVTNFVVGADGKFQCGVQDSYIDELKVYKKALSQEEITDYNAPYVLQNKLDEYDALIVASDASEEKKAAFKTVIDDIRARAQKTTDTVQLKALEAELQAAYNTFTGPERGVMSFEVISDTHIPGTDNSNATNQKLIDALNDITNDYQDVSAVLNCGDFSSDGSENQVKGYYDIIESYKENFELITAVGNHDVRWKSGWNEVENRYLAYNRQYMGDVPQGQSYYDKWIDEYHFVVLNTQWDTKDRAYLSPEELDWLDETMAEGAAADKPIFVVLHQPLYDTYTNSNAWPVGVQDYALKEVLRKYPQTIMFNGHIHDGVGAIEVKQTEFGTMVDVPGMKDNDYGDGRGQLGFHVTVYEDKVRLDLRDYQNNEWVSDNSYTISLDPATYPAGKMLDVSFDDGTASDSTGNNNNGTIKGDVEFVPGVDGGKAVHITNDKSAKASQYIDFGEGLKLGQDDFTMMFWYKAASGNKEAGTILANKAADAEAAGVLAGSTGEKNGLGLSAAAAGNSNVNTAQYALADGKWHAVAATFDRDGSMTLYVDGKKKESKDIRAWAGASMDTAGMNLMLGADSKGENGAQDIYVDNLRIYKKAIGASEIATTWSPYELTADETTITVSWPLPDGENVEPASLILDGVKVQDIASGETSKTITDLKPGTTHTVGVVNREKANSRNFRDVYSFKITTQADKTMLEELYNTNKDKDVSKYTEATKEAWKTALKKAETVLTAEKPSSKEVTEGYDTLLEALNGLKEKADMSVLEEKIKAVKNQLAALDISQYTQDSVDTVKTALENAEKMLAQDLSIEEQTQIQEIADVLQKALDGLEKKQEGSGDNPDNGSGENPDNENGQNPGNGADSGSGNTGNTDKGSGQISGAHADKAVKTGDGVHPALWGLAAVLALGAAVTACVKKERKKRSDFCK